MASIPAGRRHPSLPPTHPGAVLRHDVLPALGITVAAAAGELGVTRQALHAILAGRAAVSTTMALRLGRWLGNGPQLWLAMQQAHDLWHAERDLAEAMRAIPTRRAA